MSLLAKWLGRAAAAPAALPPRGYEPAAEGDLLSVTVQALDRELQAVTARVRQGAPASAAEIRGRIDADGHWTLYCFARRCAALALREPAGSWCEAGLTAIAMIDETQLDRRDIEWALGLLSHAIEATGADRAGLVERASALASPRMAEIVARARVATPLSAWGYAQIGTAAGPGLIHAGQARYEPSVDLTAVALRLSEHLAAGRYTAVPEIAAEVPGVWFGKGQRQAERLLKRARAAIAVRGTLRKGLVDEPSSQLLLVWVVEMPTAEDALALLGCVDGAPRRPPRFTVGLVSGPLVGLLVGGSGAMGVEAFESAKTLRALADEIRVVLQAVLPEPAG